MAARRNTIPLLLALLYLGTIGSISAAVFTFQNHCGFTVWPGTLAFDKSRTEGGFALSPGSTNQLSLSTGWFGRIWPRTGCNLDATGKGNCSTGNCDGPTCLVNPDTPVTVVEVMLGGRAWEKDFYDVSLVYGHNVAVGIRPTGGVSGDCQYAGCVADLNGNCPPELQVKDSRSVVVGCKSACEAFQKPEYCCTAASTPGTCPPTKYSKLFQDACPATNTGSMFNCAGSNFTVTFCPNKDDSTPVQAPSHSSKGFRPHFTKGTVFSIFILLIFLMF